MKVFISFLFVLSLALCIDAFGWPGGCKTDEDCDETECCVKQGGQFGICMQRPLEGERCIPTGKHKTMYQQAASCPCAAGFKCSSSGKRKFPGMKYTKPPTCQAVPESTIPPRTTE